MDNIIINGRILELGRKELAEHELRISIQQVNNSVVQTNKRTLTIAYLAAIFSFASLIKALWPTGKVQVQELQETNKLLKTQIQTLEHLNATFLKTDTSRKK